MLEGKLPRDVLDRLLRRLPRRDPSILIGPETGEDAAALALGAGERVVVATADPITFVTKEPGWHAVHVNANDVATRGARPRWFLATLLLPPGSEAELADVLFDEIARACESVGASLVGGHAEVTGSVARPVVVGAMLGTLLGPDGRLVRTAGAKPGDALLLTGGVAIEGTAALGAELAGASAALPADLLERSRRLLHDPGISVVPAATIAARVPGVRAMHDPTEGGLATALHELCDASGLGVEVDAAAVVLLPETRALCAALGLDPLGLLASGALLVSADQEVVPALTDAWERAGIAAAQIGRVTGPGTRRTLIRDSQPEPLPVFERDELARHLEHRALG